jgi:hypothetical protein
LYRKEHPLHYQELLEQQEQERREQEERRTDEPGNELTPSPASGDD